MTVLIQLNLELFKSETMFQICDTMFQRYFIVQYFYNFSAYYK